MFVNDTQIKDTPTFSRHNIPSEQSVVQCILRLHSINCLVFRYLCVVYDFVHSSVRFRLQCCASHSIRIRNHRIIYFHNPIRRFVSATKRRMTTVATQWHPSNESIIIRYNARARARMCELSLRTLLSPNLLVRARAPARPVNWNAYGLGVCLCMFM